MLEFFDISGKNLVSYQEFNFPFTKSRLQAVRGLNGHGKSLIFATMGNLLFNESPLDERRGTGRRMHTADSLVQCRLINKSKWVVQQAGSNKGVSYVINKGGKELRPAKIIEAQRLLKELMPISSDIFYTTILLNANYTHPLLNSRAAIRHDYFEHAFDLSVYDAIYKELNNRMVEVKQASSSLYLANSRHEEITKELADIAPVSEQLDSLASRLDTLQRKHNQQQNQSVQLATWLNLAKAIVSNLSPIDIEKQLSHNEELLKKGEIALEKAQQQWAQQEAYQRYNKQIIAINSKLSRLPQVEFTSIDAKERDELINAIKQQHELIPLAKKTKDLRDELVNLPRKKQIGLNLEKTEHRIGALRDLLSNLKLIKNQDQCPTCGSHLDKATLDSMISSAQQEGNYLTKCLADYKIQQRRIVVLAELSNNEVPTLSQIQENIKEYTKRLNTLNTKEKIYKERQDLINLANQLVPISAVQPIRQENIKNIKTQIAKIRNACETYRNDLLMHEKIAQQGNNFTNVTEAQNYYDQLQEQMSIDNNRLQKLSVTMQRIQSDQAKNTMLTAELEKIGQEVFQLEQSARKRELYEQLVAAYGPKGLRIARVQALTQTWLDNMNNNAAFTFREPYRFSLDVDVNRFVILAERSNKISEIAGSLSGAEMRSFALLNMLSLLPLLPNNYRANIGILDEMEANNDKYSMQLYCTECIPHLLNLVPNITIVTPRTIEEMPLTDAVEWQVSKRQAKSSLVLA